MEGRGKSRRRNPYQTWKRRASAMLAVLLTLSLVLGDISGLSRTVMAGQRSVKEEFRIHREAILKAAEEAIEKGEPLNQPLAITSDKEKTETKYQELLPADGTVYEIFPEIEQVQDVDSPELRVFIRLEEGADPASYTLTGEEELIFLYVNGGGVTAEGRVNIDGYVSDFTEVEPLEEEDDAVGSGNAGGSGSAVGTGSGTDNGEAAGSNETSENIGNTGNEIAGDEAASAESETTKTESEENINTNTSSTLAPEDSAADLTQGADEEEADDETTAPDSNQKPEDTLPAETEENEEAEETEADKKEDAGKPEKNPAESGADASAETGDKTDEKETSESMDKDESADKDATDKEVIGDADKEEDTDNYEKKDETEAAGDESEDKDEDKNTSTSDEDQDENTSDDDAADTNDAEDADAKDDTGSAVTVSLRQIQRVAASLASDSDAEKETTGSAENGSNGSGSNGTGSTEVGSTGSENTGSGSSGAGSGSSGSGNKNSSDDSDDDEDSYYENTGDPFDEEDAAALEDEEAAFKKVKKLDGTRYDEAVLDEVLAIRAFVVSMEDAGFDKEELLEGAHHLTYTVSEGEARVVYNPEYVRDEAVVTFGIIPAEGMEVYQVTANGEELAETERTAAIASASEAKRASSSEVDVDEERAVYYQIPEVLEDQDVQIQVVEEGYNSHPAFLQSRAVNGVTVTVSAEEGILPAGTELSVEEVTVQIQDALKEKVESEAEDNTTVTSVIAYDINLMLDGEKLDNSWSESGYVNVTFSGNPIEEMTDNASKIEVVAVDDNQQETLSAQNADTVTAETVELESISDQNVEGTVVDKVSFEAEHFTIYAVVAGGNKYDEYEMQIGETVQLKSDVTGIGVNHGGWESSNPRVVSIISSANANNTNVQANAAGTAIITHSYSQWGRKQTEKFTIIVIDSDAFRINWYVNGSLEDTTYANEGDEPRTEITPVRTGTGIQKEIVFVGWATEPNSKEYKSMGDLPSVSGDEDYYTVFMTLSQFYFLLPNESNESTEWSSYMYCGDGLVIVPDGYTASSSNRTRWYNSEYPISDYIYEFPTDAEIRTGLEKYYNGKNGKDQYDQNWDYEIEWTTLSIAPSRDYDNVEFDSQLAIHIDGMVKLDTSEKVTFSYLITEPDLSVTMVSKNHKKGIDTVEINSTVSKDSDFTTDGTLYNATKFYNGINYVFDGWYTDPTYSNKADLRYLADSPKSFYARYIPPTEYIVINKTLENDELFPNASVSDVEFTLFETDSSWNVRPNGVSKTITINATGKSGEIAIEKKSAYYLLTETKTAGGYLEIEEPIKLKCVLNSDEFTLTCENTADFVREQKIVIEGGKNGAWEIRVTNYPISVAELPETGGPGLIMMERFGWILLLLAMAGMEVQIFSKRRRKEQ